MAIEVCEIALGKRNGTKNERIEISVRQKMEEHVMASCGIDRSVDLGAQAGSHDVCGRSGISPMDGWLGLPNAYASIQPCIHCLAASPRGSRGGEIYNE